MSLKPPAPNNIRHWRLRRFLGLSVFVIGLSPIVCPAAGTVFSTGFESPYSLGPLQGQPGAPPVWVTAGFGGSTATVENSIVNSGSQAVQVVKAGAANTDRRWAVQASGLPSQRYVLVDWDMRVSRSNIPNTLNNFGPFFGMEAYDAVTTPYLVGSLGVDSTTGEVLYQAKDSGDLTSAGLLVDFDQWNHFRLVLDFSSDTYQGYLNGALIASSGFVDGSFGLTRFTDADIATFAAGDNPASQTASATAWFDNYTVRDGLLGDYDLDGDVDAADYARWRSTFGNTVSPAGNLADGNHNGVVDAADYVVWRDNLGASIASGSSLGSSKVPEPMTLSTVAIGLCVISGAWRTRKQ